MTAHKQWVIVLQRGIIYHTNNNGGIVLCGNFHDVTSMWVKVMVTQPEKCHDLMPLQFRLRLRLHKDKWGARTMATAASIEVKVKVSLSWDKLTNNP